jgi:hypothetical protein
MRKKFRKVLTTAIAANRPISSKLDEIDVSMMAAATWKVNPATSRLLKRSQTTLLPSIFSDPERGTDVLHHRATRRSLPCAQYETSHAGCR